MVFGSSSHTCGFTALNSPSLKCVWGCKWLAVVVNRIWTKRFIVSSKEFVCWFFVIATVAAPIVAMSHVFIRSVPDAAYVAVYSFGPAMMTFSTVLVAFYWSGLIFYKKKNQLWNRKLFIGLLVFFLVRSYYEMRLDLYLTRAGDVAIVYFIRAVIRLSHSVHSRRDYHYCSGK